MPKEPKPPKKPKKKPKKETGIFERPKGSGNWYARYYDEFGTDKKVAAGTKISAIELRTKMKEEVRRIKLGLQRSASDEKRSRVTVEDLIEHYRAKFESKKAKTANRGYAKRWISDIGHLLASEVVPGDIENWQIAKAAGDMGPATINRHTAFLRRIFSLGMRDRRVSDNPLALGRVEKLSENDPRDRVLTPDEEKKLLPKLEPIDRAAFVISLYAGLRQGELLRLERQDIDVEKRAAKLRDTKSGKTQSAVLNAAAMEAILFVMSQHEDNLLFPNEKGTGPMSGSRLTDRLKKAARELKDGSDILWHTTRHTFVTRLADGGHDIGIVKAAARHSTITMTDSYIHTADSATRAAVDSLCKNPEDEGPLFPAKPVQKGHLRAVK